MTGGNCTPYGLTSWGDLFTPRQLVALTTFSDLVLEARARVLEDFQSLVKSSPEISNHWKNAAKKFQPLEISPEKVPTIGKNDPKSSNDWKTAYADAVATYLACGVSQMSRYACMLCAWNKSNENVAQAFGRQAIPMVWDCAESHPLVGSLNIDVCVGWVVSAIQFTGAAGMAIQADAQTQTLTNIKVVSTDPPYYDNIGYADLSDFFYVWLRRSLRSIYPELFTTLAVPKAEELVATPYRHGSKEKAETFFLDGMTQAMHQLSEHSHPAYPVTIYYAFKQSEDDGEDGMASTGWQTFLDAVIRAGFAITGTWPLRTERTVGLKGDINALASSIIIVCRKRDVQASVTTRQAFVAALKRELGPALKHLQRGGIAPVDLAQAAIGPGMGVYTSYSKVLDAAGSALSVREALALINQALDEVLAEQEGDFDADTRWALAWFEQHGFEAGEYGVAETLSKAKNTSVAGMVEAGILVSKSGKVRLLRPDELPEDWDPEKDKRKPEWKMVHHLVRLLGTGESAAAVLVARLGGKAEIVPELAYRLYTICERKKRSSEALAYNALVQSWPEITRLAKEEAKKAPPVQQELI